MTVKELIEKLQEFDEDDELCYAEGGKFYDIIEIVDFNTGWIALYGKKIR